MSREFLLKGYMGPPRQKHKQKREREKYETAWKQTWLFNQTIVPRPPPLDIDERVRPKRHRTENFQRTPISAISVGPSCVQGMVQVESDHA